MRDAAANAILAQPENERAIRAVYELRLEYLNMQVLAKLEEVETLKKSDEYKEIGPCELELDEVLKSLTVSRQAYHGKSFIGNHHVMLKPKSIEKLCNSIVNFVMKLDSNEEVVLQANTISTKFKELFTL